MNSLLLALTLATASPAAPEANFTPLSGNVVQIVETVSASSKCVTPQMVCAVGMQPVGSPCFCGQVAGIILP
jgi:hypothetical protein